MRFLLCVFLTLLVTSPALGAPGDYTILKRIESPLISPDGLAWDGNSLWVTECQSETNYSLDPMSGEVLQSSVSPFFIDHLSWDGEAMWGSEAHTNRIHRFDANVADPVETLEAPTSVMGLAWANGSLWVMDSAGRRVYRFGEDPQTGFSTPGNNPCGLGWDGRCLWVSDLTNKSYDQVDPGTGETVLSIDVPGGPGRLPTGIAFVDGYAWIVDEDPTDPAIYQINLEFLPDGPCGRPEEEIPAEPQPQQPSDGGHESPSNSDAEDGGWGCTTSAGASTAFASLILLAVFPLRGRRARSRQ